MRRSNMGFNCLDLRSSPGRDVTYFSCFSYFCPPSRLYKCLCILDADRSFVYEDAGAGSYGVKAEANPFPI